MTDEQRLTRIEAAVRHLYECNPAKRWIKGADCIQRQEDVPFDELVTTGIEDQEGE